MCPNCEKLTQVMACGHPMPCGKVNEDAPVEILECAWCGELRQAQEHEKAAVEKAKELAHAEGCLCGLAQAMTDEGLKKAHEKVVAQAVAVAIENCMDIIRDHVGDDGEWVSDPEEVLKAVQSLCPESDTIVKAKIEIERQEAVASLTAEIKAHVLDVHNSEPIVNAVAALRSHYEAALANWKIAIIERDRVVAETLEYVAAACECNPLTPDEIRALSPMEGADNDKV